jgi:hypothetical protein
LKDRGSLLRVHHLPRIIIAFRVCCSRFDYRCLDAGWEVPCIHVCLKDENKNIIDIHKPFEPQGRSSKHIAGNCGVSLLVNFPQSVKKEDCTQFYSQVFTVFFTMSNNDSESPPAARVLVGSNLNNLNSRKLEARCRRT